MRAQLAEYKAKLQQLEAREQEQQDLLLDQQQEQQQQQTWQPHDQQEQQQEQGIDLQQQEGRPQQQEERQEEEQGQQALHSQGVRPQQHMAAQQASPSSTVTPAAEGLASTPPLQQQGLEPWQGQQPGAADGLIGPAAGLDSPGGHMPGSPWHNSPWYGTPSSQHTPAGLSWQDADVGYDGPPASSPACDQECTPAAAEVMPLSSSCAQHSSSSKRVVQQEDEALEGEPAAAAAEMAADAAAGGRMTDNTFQLQAPHSPAVSGTSSGGSASSHSCICLVSSDDEEGSPGLGMSLQDRLQARLAAAALPIAPASAAAAPAATVAATHGDERAQVSCCCCCHAWLGQHGRMAVCMHLCMHDCVPSASCPSSTFTHKTRMGVGVCNTWPGSFIDLVPCLLLSLLLCCVQAVMLQLQHAGSNPVPSPPSPPAAPAPAAGLEDADLPAAGPGTGSMLSPITKALAEMDIRPNDEMMRRHAPTLGRAGKGGTRRRRLQPLSPYRRSAVPACSARSRSSRLARAVSSEEDSEEEWQEGTGAGSGDELNVAQLGRAVRIVLAEHSGNFAVQRAAGTSLAKQAAAAGAKAARAARSAA